MAEEEPIAKKKRIEELTVSNLSSPSRNTTVHGVMTCVSPVRKGRKNSAVKYFDGKVADGTGAMRVICFNAKLRAALLKSVEEKTAIAIKNCHVQKSRTGGDDLEIVIDSSSKIDESPVTIDITTLPPTRFSTLDAVLLTTPNQELNFHAKVTAVDDAVQVKEWKKQDITIADSSGSLKLVAWEDAVGKLDEGKSYSFTSATVKLYADETFVSLGPRSQFVEIDDIGDIDETPLSSSGQDSRVMIISVVGVKNILRYPCCPSCKGRVEVEVNGIATCGKCHMTVSGRTTSYSVHFLAQDHDGETHEMTAFERTILAAFPSIKVEDVAEKLLGTMLLKIMLGKENIVYSINPVDTWREN